MLDLLENKRPWPRPTRDHLSFSAIKTYQQLRLLRDCWSRDSVLRVSRVFCLVANNGRNVSYSPTNSAVTNDTGFAKLKAQLLTSGTTTWRVYFPPGAYTYTNNLNYAVKATPTDVSPDVLGAKLDAGAALVKTTNTLSGASTILQSGLTNPAMRWTYGYNTYPNGLMGESVNMLHTIRQIINDDEKFRSILRGLNKDFYHQETYILLLTFFLFCF